jgi:hypothetical protein
MVCQTATPVRIGSKNQWGAANFMNGILDEKVTLKQGHSADRKNALS